MAAKNKELGWTGTQPQKLIWAVWVEFNGIPLINSKGRRWDILRRSFDLLSTHPGPLELAFAWTTCPWLWPKQLGKFPPSYLGFTVLPILRKRERLRVGNSSALTETCAPSGVVEIICLVLLAEPDDWRKSYIVSMMNKNFFFLIRTQAWKKTQVVQNVCLI